MPAISLTDLKTHIESDLSDAALGRVRADAVADVTGRYGPWSGAGEITITLTGGTRVLGLARPGSAASEIKETDGLGVETTLAISDWRLLHGGRVLERLNTGTNPRTAWDRLVEITYTPDDEDSVRDRIVIDLVKLSLQYDATKGTKVGDAGATAVDYQAERERLLSGLVSHRGPFVA